MKNHEPVDGYTLYSNFSPMGSVMPGGKLHTLETLTEYMQGQLPQVPLEAVLIQRNAILGGWSVYLRNDYGYIAADFNRGVMDLINLHMKAMRMDPLS